MLGKWPGYKRVCSKYIGIFVRFTSLMCPQCLLSFVVSKNECTRMFSSNGMSIDWCPVIYTHTTRQGI